MLNSLATTVATPVKKPGRKAPSRMSASTGSGTTFIVCGCGYSSASAGANTWATPAACMRAQSASIVRG